jgi:hypothetical protein
MSKAKKREPGKIVAGTNRNLALPSGLDSLSDVTVATPTDGQVLQYSTANSQWENKNAVIKYVALTEAEYNALVTKDPNTLYLVRA